MSTVSLRAVSERPPSGEHARDELGSADAIAALESALRSAGPSFHHRLKLKGLTVTKLRRGVALEVRFDKKQIAPAIPGKVNVILSTALAKVLLSQLRVELGV